MLELRAEPLELDQALQWLRDHDDAPTLCSSTFWYRAAARARGPQHLIAVAIRQGATTVAVTVLAEDTADWRTGSPGQARLRWPFQELGYNFAPVFAPGFDASELDWLAALRELFPSSRLELRRCDEAACSGLHTDTAERSPGPPTFALDVDGELDNWKGSLRSSHRRDFDYYRRRIGKLGGRFTDLTETDNLCSFLDPCFELHASRVADKGQTSLYLREDNRTFLRQLASVARTSARVSLLHIGDEIVGGCLAFVYRGHYSCFMPGWDPRRRSLDLGRQLIYQQILGEFERGLACIDLLGGDLAYKREFGLRPRSTTDLVMVPGHGARLRENLVHGAVELYRRLIRT